MHEKLMFKEECFAIQGAVFEVYKEMGSGFLEAVYQECLERELAVRGVPFERQPLLALTFKGLHLSQTYRPDLVCFGTILLELKAAKALSPEHRAQVLHYLKATGLRLGLLVNFGSHPRAQIERIIL
ncbi:MAG: GxxExxY protein [Acidobacteria bacterium]|nr:GxxExxY protein [Acidobacteriota bacterium]